MRAAAQTSGARLTRRIDRPPRVLCTHLNDSWRHPFYLDGLELNRGAQVVFSPYALHRDARFFSEPDRFDPDRFLNGSSEALPKLAYLPFGGGPRVCIGQHFATMEAELLLATLLQQVERHVAPDFRMELAPVITMRSRHGLPVRVRRREARVAAADAAQ
jgi:cytochrome P450